MQYCELQNFWRHKAKKPYKAKTKDPFKKAKFPVRRYKQIYLLFEHIPRKIPTFEADQSHGITFFSGFLPKQVRALPAIIVISGCII